ncbi:endo-1,4-beta-xylanase [Thermogutta sp.]|uniref:endo-1,4-beta-xylanase n=1 Tax=Thermogutta sp. TaxID=1962930 RepID=UPI00321FB35F
MSRTSTLFLAMVWIAAAATILPSRLKAAEENDELWQTAEERIEKYRKGDIEMLVTLEGKPVANAEVTVEQTRHAFLFGCNIFKWGRIEDPKLEEAYRQRFAEIFNYATVGFYWPTYERRQAEPSHEYARQVAEWCREHGIAVKGHPLAWNFVDPAWLPDDPKEILRLQLARIEDCVSRFAGLIDRWDVVNEATEFDRPSCQQRGPKMTRMWQEVGQTEFTKLCFERARKANPNATLIINDYVISPKYERLLEQLVDDQNRPIFDVIGIQSHMHGGTWSNGQIWDVCERFSRFKVPLHFTETTIVSGELGRGRPRPWVTTPEGEEYQAREVVRFYTMLFSHPAVQAITWWDFSDYRAWQGAPAGLLRQDMSPKPAYTELYKLIKQKWWTRETVITDAAGRVKFRGFAGDYTLRVNKEGIEPVDMSFRVEACITNSMQIELRERRIAETAVQGARSEPADSGL